MGSLSALADLQREELHEINAVPPHLHETAEALADGARNSFNLLTDLLDWSRAQRGDIAFRPGRHELQGLVAEQIGVIRRTASDKGVVLENRLGELQVHADEYMLKTVIRNLLSNAVKFTPEGGRVTVTARDEAAGVTISVSDTGVGMSEEQQRKVFDPSVKTSTPGTNAEGGTGLGLTVCREFVERHGGTIRVDSELGVGSTINVYLPNPL
jgi:signal transduction histidine kinase